MWIDGHVHEAFDYCIGETRIVSNPKGYLGENAGGFRDNLILKINV